MASRMKKRYEPVEMEKVTDPAEVAKIKAEAGIKVPEPDKKPEPAREPEKKPEPVKGPEPAKKVSLEDIKAAIDDLADYTAASYDRINRKVTDLDVQSQATEKQVKKLAKRVENLESELKAIKEGGAPVGPSVSLLRSVPSRDYTGDATAYMVLDADGTRYPIKDERIARFYDKGFLVAPVKVENGLVRRLLTAKEASEQGC